MADSKISKKYHPSGSFARRILTLAILLLVIPLFLQTLFLYREEYNQKLSDVELDLELLGKERAHFIGEMIQANWTLLDNVKKGPIILDPADCEVPPSNVKPLYMTIALPTGVSERFVLASRSRQALLVGKKESGTTALIIPIPFSKLGGQMSRVYPIRLSLVDGKGVVVWESRKFTDPAEILEIKEGIPATEWGLRLAVEKDQIQALHLQTYYFHFATLLFFVGVLGGGAVYLLTRRIGRPLKNLCHTMERVSEGALHARYSPDRMGFEINQLGLQFNQTLDALLRQVQETEKERIGREKLAAELRIGHEIQEGLLPSHVPGLPGIEIGTAYVAAQEVNGDFYDLFRLPNGQLFIAICDTAGKGISACLFSLGLRSLLRSLASVTPELADIVRQANDLYSIDAHEPSMFSTLWVGLYDPESRRLVYCSQGHPPALLRRRGELQALWTEGIALGAQKMDVIPTKEVTLEEGDFLLLYTDGILEAHDLDDHLFGKTRLHEFLLHTEGQTAGQIADQLIEEVRLFKGSAPQHDDMTLVAISVLPLSS